MGDFRLDNHLPDDYLISSLREDVRAGLTATPKQLPPKWFYDEAGSALFERITELPEYYQTRAERAILDAHAADVPGLGPVGTLVELGAGSASKTRLLLAAFGAAGTLRRYVPVDVSVELLADTGRALVADLPWLDVHAVAADFATQLDRLPVDGPALVAFLGGTIGNFPPAARGTFLRTLRGVLSPGDGLLLGVDLVKDPAVLVPAYNDAEGVTAAFDRNVLYVVNRLLKADFDPGSFRHLAVWNAAEEWIEMRLESQRDQQVVVDGLGLVVDFARGEQLLTELSAKFRRGGITAELAAAGFAVTTWWTDPADRFALIHATAG
jgi:L-histidine N-alpha-methyltransferase